MLLAPVVTLYAILLIYGRFCGVCHDAYMPFFSLLENESYYPDDFYVSNSVIPKATWLFDLLQLAGPVSSSTYFIFFFYSATSFVHIYFIYKIIYKKVYMLLL